MLRLGIVLASLSVVLAGCITDGDVTDDAEMAADGVDCRVPVWTMACTVIASPNDSPSQTEIDITVNPTDPLNAFVASKDMDPLASNGCVWSVGQVTYDGGRTWETVYAGGTLEERADETHPAYGWECVTDPIMVYDEQGVLYYPLQIYMNDQAGDNSCARQTAPVVPNSQGCTSAFFLSVSHDGGRTFPPEAILTQTYITGAFTFHDYPRMVVNPASGTVTTVWNAIPGGIYVSSTRDGGASVDPPASIPGLFFETGLTATSDGTVYFVASALLERSLAVSVDDARSFVLRPGLPATVPSDCTPDDRSEYRCGKGGIELAADISGGEYEGRLYAVWPDGRNDAADIMIAWSDDQGTSWSEPVQVNGDGTDSVQWMPRVVVGENGVVHVAYLDRSYDPDDLLYDATYSWSADGGATWQHLRLSETLSDGNLGIHQDGGSFIGDYIGIDETGGHVYIGYPLTPNGVAEVAVSHVIHPSS